MADNLVELKPLVSCVYTLRNEPHSRLSEFALHELITVGLIFEDQGTKLLLLDDIQVLWDLIMVF